MKTHELTGSALDWAVAKCEGEDYSPVTTYSGIGAEFPPTNYSTDWSQGGPIIEREGIDIAVSESGEEWNAQYRFKKIRDDEYWSGPTPLIAAMRCYVASKLGDEVEIPEGLKCEQ
jgi:hypothetical protein